MKHEPNPFFGKGKCIKKIRKGNVQVSCFQNFTYDGKPYLNVNLKIFYKTAHGKSAVKKGLNFNKDEIASACVAMNEMHSWLLGYKMPEQLGKIIEARKEAARA